MTISDFLCQTMKKLIVTADNFGLDISTNSAIIESHKNGVVTGAGLLVTRDGFTDAVSIVNENTGLDTGLQLDLDEFFFVDREEEKTKFYWDDTMPISKIVAVIEQQIEKYQNTGLKMSWLSSRYNVHLRPELLPIICLLCREHKIRAIRFSEKFYQDNYQSLKLEWFKAMVAQNELFVTGHFIDGWYFGNLDSFTNGVAELGCKPARYGGKGETDFKACIDPEVKKYVESSGIQLTTFAKLFSNSKIEVTG